MKKPEPYIIDDKNYTVVGINGFRRGCLNRKEAVQLARTMQAEMDANGWRGRMKVYYRDGSPVAWTVD